MIERCLECEKAAKALTEHLDKLGIVATVGHPADDDAPKELHVGCRYKKDVKRVPKEWDGYEVIAEYIGVIRPL